MLFDFPRGLLLLKAGTGRLVEDTATGNPLTFNTNAAKPLKSLLIPFTPTQSGTGDPSPENVRPIAGVTGLTAYHAGANLVNESDIVTGYAISANGTVSQNSGACYVDYMPVLNGKAYIISARNGQEAWNYRLHGYNAEKQWVKQIDITNVAYQGEYSLQFEPEDGIAFIQLSMSKEATDVSLIEGESFPVDWTDEAGTVYGGTLDLVTGVLSVGWVEKTVSELRLDKKADHIFQGYFSDRKYGAGVFSIISDTYKTITAVVSTGSTIETIYAQYGDGIYINSGSGTFYICDSNYTEVEAFQTAMANVQIAYELATPQETQLTPEQVAALVGDNTIWTDTNGENTAVYLKKA